MTPAANPEIYGKDITETSLPEVSKTVKKQTKELSTYQSILEDLEKNVVLKQAEIDRQKLRNIAYATNANRGATKDRNAFALSLKDKSGYSAPKNIEEKVFYDIAFRLKELGFAQNIDLSQKIDYNDKLAREVIAFQRLANLKGQEGVVGPETYKALLQTPATASLPSNQHTQTSETGGDAQDNTTRNVEFVTDEQIKNAESADIASKIIKKFEVATTLSNTMDNIKKEDLKAFDKLDAKVNKDDKLYNEFENSIVDKISKKYTETGISTPSASTRANVAELLRNYAEGYLDDNTEELKEIELDPNVFFAIRDTVVEFLFDPHRDVDQKKWLILFVRSFTDNFNDIIQTCEDELTKSALTMLTSNRLLN